jgi:hypothetical protein
MKSYKSGSQGIYPLFESISIYVSIIILNTNRDETESVRIYLKLVIAKKFIAKNVLCD